MVQKRSKLVKNGQIVTEDCRNTAEYSQKKSKNRPKSPPKTAYWAQKWLFYQGKRPRACQPCWHLKRPKKWPLYLSRAPGTWFGRTWELKLIGLPDLTTFWNTLMVRVQNVGATIKWNTFCRGLSSLIDNLLWTSWDHFSSRKAVNPRIRLVCNL